MLTPRKHFQARLFWGHVSHSLAGALGSKTAKKCQSVHLSSLLRNRLEIGLGKEKRPMLNLLDRAGCHYSSTLHLRQLVPLLPNCPRKFYLSWGQNCWRISIASSRLAQHEPCLRPRRIRKKYSYTMVP